jgi:heme/copper-type cytochrome/quinol oxidase subunit 4
MIENLPRYISLIFGLTTVATLLLFYWTVKNSSCETTRKKSVFILFSLTIGLTIQAVLTLKNVYNSDTTSIPPKILLFGILPTILIIIYLFVTQKGQQFIDSLPLKNITYLNVVRIPVEIVLLWLFLNKTVPQLMTFEGRNFDIIAGITAPFIAYFGFTKGKLSRLYSFRRVCS